MVLCVIFPSSVLSCEGDSLSDSLINLPPYLHQGPVPLPSLPPPIPHTPLPLSLSPPAAEAIHIANMLARHGFFFCVEGLGIPLRDDGTLYRFQVSAGGYGGPQNLDSVTKPLETLDWHIQVS